MQKNLRRLLEDLEECEIIGHGDPSIQSVVYDSRKVSIGSLFVAIPGFKTDGLGFVPDAIERGAVAIVAQKSPDHAPNLPWIVVPDARKALADISWTFYRHPEAKLIPIAVTGTNGKTTVATLLSSVLSLCGHKCGIVGTLGIFDGDRDIETNRTTPESTEIAHYLDEMVERNCTHVVMEATSIGIDLQRTRGIPFSVAIFTNLTRDHIDYHQTMEAYREAKLNLFRGLNSKSTSVVNLDDPSGKQFVNSSRGNVLTYAIDSRADFQATNIKLTRDSICFDLKYAAGIAPVTAPLIGRFNVHNLLAVITAAHALGLSTDTIITALHRAKAVRGRAEVVPSTASFTVIVDYAHTPDALEKILSTLKDLDHHSILTVVGAGGDRDRGKRPQMAGIANQLSDYLYLTSDNPRSENPESILDEMAAGLPAGCSYVRNADRKAAIEATLSMAKAGDIVLIAGKGHETYQEINGVKYPFDDRQIVLEWLAKESLSA